MRGREFANLSDYYRVVWTGFLVPPETGTYRIGIVAPTASLEVDGKMLAKHEHKPWGTRSEMATLHLQKGHRYPLRVTAEALLLGGVEVLWKRVADQPDAPLPEEAKKADALVVAVGLNSNLEGEQMKVDVEGFSGGDKTSLDLLADQRKLLEQAVATGKPVIVVLMNGSPIDLSWARDHVAAILEAWYPGQAGGLAIANVLAGKSNPAGRLPLTFYRNVADLPPFGDYSMKGRTYRYFEGTPVYPFGFGLSYTTFQYGPVRVEARGDAGGVRVSTTLTNTGRVAGEEVAQLYLEPPRFDGAPRRALRGFQRVALRPGESRALDFALDPRDLSFVTRDGVRQVLAGDYRVTLGSGQPDSGVPFQAATFSTPREIRIDQ
jgi:beta-glucosidase